MNLCPSSYPFILLLLKLYILSKTLSIINFFKEMLADFFGVSNQHIYHIVTLKMMLRLNNGVRHRSNEEIYSGCLFS